MPLWKREGAWKWNKVRIPALWCKTYSLDVRGYGQSYKINIRLINAVSLHSCVISLYAVDVSITHWRYIWQDVILSCFNYISLSEIDNAVRRCQLFYHPISQVFIKIRCKKWHRQFFNSRKHKTHQYPNSKIRKHLFSLFREWQDTSRGNQTQTTPCRDFLDVPLDWVPHVFSLSMTWGILKPHEKDQLLLDRQPRVMLYRDQTEVQNHIVSYHWRQLPNLRCSPSPIPDQL